MQSYAIRRFHVIFVGAILTLLVVFPFVSRSQPLASLGLPMAQGACSATNEHLVSWLNGRWFLSGVNVPWQDGGYGADFGTVEEWGQHTYSSSATEQMFADLQAHGVNSVRWWVFADGRGAPEFDSTSGGYVTGFDAQFLPSMVDAIRLAQKYDIYLVFNLWGSDMVSEDGTPGDKGEHSGGHRDLVVESDKRQSFIDNALIPMLSHPVEGTPFTIGTHPNVLGWDIVNEPEWHITDAVGSDGKVSLAEMQRFVAEVAGAIHRHSNQLVTLGSASMKWNSDTALGADGNWWSDAALTRYDPDGYLDFYQIHYYPWMDGDEVNWSYSPLFHTWADAGFDKPTVIGELPGLTGMIDDILAGVHGNCYAGAWMWSYEGVDSSGNWPESKEAYAQFNAQHQDQVDIRPSDQPPAPPATATPVDEPSVLPATATPVDEPSAPTATAAPVDSALISNIVASSGKTYAVATLAAGEQLYSDRAYTFTAVPEAYDGQLFIRTANNDKSSTRDAFLSFALAQPATVYVAYDARATRLPAWLTDEGYADTGDIIDTNDARFNVYAKTFPAGTVTLGGNAAAPMRGARSNYTVVVVPETSATPPSGDPTDSPVTETPTDVPATETPPDEPAVGRTIFTDSLENGWDNWSWNTSVTFDNGTPSRSGNSAIAATYDAPWAGLYLHTYEAIPTAEYDTLSFWLHGGAQGGQRMRVWLRDVNGNGGPSIDMTAPANEWTRIDLPLADLGNLATISDVVWQDITGNAQPTFYIDDVALVSRSSIPASDETPAPTSTPTDVPDQPTASPTSTDVPDQPTASPTPPPAQTATASPTRTATPVPTSTATSAPDEPDAPDTFPSSGDRAFLETFDGDPASPAPWDPANWDVVVHSRDRDTWHTLEAMDAAHGPNCEPPPATHRISSYADAVFQCKNHVMTALNATGYGVIYLTPDHLVDFSQGEAVVRFDVSTLQTSQRDWLDLWITPYADHLQLPLDIGTDLQGHPRRGVHIRMDGTGPDNRFTMFRTSIIEDFTPQRVSNQNLSTGYEQFLTPDAKRRDTFELRISRTHIKFGMPDYNYWWIDTSIADLGWDQGVVQLGHHSYNPTKCDGTCAPNTWHWDNVVIDPAMPFTMIPADQWKVDPTTSPVVTFPEAAPAGSHLRFAAIGDALEVSFDGGQTWEPARKQAQELAIEGHFDSYWMPIPSGVREVQVRGKEWWGGEWIFRDFSIWTPPSSR